MSSSLVRSDWAARFGGAGRSSGGSRKPRGSASAGSSAAPAAWCSFPAFRWLPWTTSSSWCGRLPRDVGVILVAAGRGSRIGGELPKQYQPIAGVPMVLRALRPFTAHSEVAQVALVLPAEDARQPPGFLAGLAGPGLTLVAGR